MTTEEIHEVCTHGGGDPLVCPVCTQALALADPVARASFYENRCRRLEAELKKLRGEEPDDADRWGYALTEDAEFWQGAGSRAEAIDAARAEAGPGKDVWIQKGQRVDPADLLPTCDQFIEIMDQQAADNGCPDEVDDPFELAAGAKEALETALAAWAKEYVTANWWDPDGKPERVPAESAP